MKKKFFSLTITLLLSTAFIGACQSVKSEKISNEKANEAKTELNETNSDENLAQENAAKDEEWKAFKTETEVKIRDNNTLIAATRVKMKKTRQVMDALYEKRIDDLEAKNKTMQTRLDAYDANHSDWNKFKTEFNHDMDELGKALKDLTVKNV
jgi:chromosome segregation ATPase